MTLSVHTGAAYKSLAVTTVANKSPLASEGPSMFDIRRPIALAGLATDANTVLTWDVNVNFESRVMPRYSNVRLMLIWWPPETKTGWRYAHLRGNMTTSVFWWSSIIPLLIIKPLICISVWLVTASNPSVIWLTTSSREKSHHRRWFEGSIQGWTLWNTKQHPRLNQLIVARDLHTSNRQVQPD